MEAVAHVLHLTVVNVVSLASIILELFGAIILFYTGVKGFIQWVTRKEECSVNLAEGIAMCLEFLMAGEVLHTILAEEIQDLVILGALVILRGIMTLEIHWEIKNEKAELAAHKMLEKEHKAE
jgi:uncharacterized membrane protein